MSVSQNDEIKRVFFGLEISAPWPHEWPKGRVIEESSRHITLAFLGNAPLKELISQLDALPKPSFEIGMVGKCDQLLFLPERHPRVAAYHVKWLEKEEALNQFQKELASWLMERRYMEEEKRPFLSHITVARSPFDKEEWKRVFQELPVVAKALHLYESTGNLVYHSHWNYAFLPAFDEISHTADIAFHVRGKNCSELFRHAQIALSFKFPSLLSFFSKEEKANLDEIIIALNEIVSEADQTLGCPFKAVSFHDKVKSDEKGILHWEMIIDV